MVISVERMRKSDAYTIEHLVPSKELMYRAATGVYESYKEWEGKRIAIVVGGGNNGGDGYALAGILKKNGISSDVIKVSEKLSEDGKHYCDIAMGMGVGMFSFDVDMDLSKYDVIVDCILGTGFVGDVRGTARDVIEAINKSGAYIISVDIPSGMNGDTGEASLAVVSDLTVSIGFIKQGLVTDAAKKYIKALTNVDIGIVLVGPSGTVLVVQEPRTTRTVPNGPLGEYEMELLSGRPENMEGRLPREVRTYDLLDELGIEYMRTDHEAANTMEACNEIDKILGVIICKNLFLCNRQKTAFYLLMMPGDKKFKTKELSAQINSARLSFAEAEDMLKYLDIEPGSVSIMGLMNDKGHAVKLLIDEDVLEGEFIGCHPCVCTSSLKIRTEDIIKKFLPATGHEYQTVHLVGED